MPGGQDDDAEFTQVHPSEERVVPGGQDDDDVLPQPGSLPGIHADDF